MGEAAFLNEPESSSPIQLGAEGGSPVCTSWNHHPRGAIPCERPALAYLRSFLSFPGKREFVRFTHSPWITDFEGTTILVAFEGLFSRGCH